MREGHYVLLFGANMKSDTTGRVTVKLQLQLQTRCVSRAREGREGSKGRSVNHGDELKQNRMLGVEAALRALKQVIYFHLQTYQADWCCLVHVWQPPPGLPICSRLSSPYYQATKITTNKILAIYTNLPGVRGSLRSLPRTLIISPIPLYIYLHLHKLSTPLTLHYYLIQCLALASPNR